MSQVQQDLQEQLKVAGSYLDDNALAKSRHHNPDRPARCADYSLSPELGVFDGSSLEGGEIMRTWICPKCQHEVRAIATQVAHRCPSNKNLMTEYKEEK
jgi:DNA-directed RNA polymerase subunit RPC12/RpoP